MQEGVVQEIDVAVIGAGLAGLTCAQELRQAGYAVVVLEKSRGLGGRAATRRLTQTCADHGLRYLDVQGTRSQALIDRLLAADVIVPWTEITHSLNESGVISVDSAQYWRYAAPEGMSAIAKTLATDLEIRRNQRVTEISPTLLPAPQGWKLAIESSQPVLPILARSLVIAIPAPQAIALLEPLVKFAEIKVMADKLRSVAFDPCLTAIAVYPAARLTEAQTLDWKALTLQNDPVLRWIGLDSSKRPNPLQPVVVLHSTPAFARQNFDAADLHIIGQQMLNQAAQRLVPWLQTAELLQVHRWRYAFVARALPESCLVSSIPLPIACCGEWCGGQQVEAAIESGMAAANQLGAVLQQK